MIDILIKAGGFILIIMLGFALKTKGVCTREHGSFLSTIIMNITLPCSLLSSINNLEITPHPISSPCLWLLRQCYY